MGNNEKAERVVEILDQMENDGEFSRLSDDEISAERQTLGMRLRADMEEQNDETKTIRGIMFMLDDVRD